MKMLFVTCAEGVMVEVRDLFKRLDISSYTEFSPVRGVGRNSGPRMGTHTWPGRNGIIFAVVEDEKAETAALELSRLKEDEYIRREGLKVFIWNIERVI
ncbi:MAG: hypothetical protein J7L41_07765 [Synergistetes bacterium]|nr:hypothetical protein [Synergistota bacterium]